MYQKCFYCSRILKTFRFLPFLEKKVDILKKERFENFRKRLISQVSFQMRLGIHYCAFVLKTFKTLSFLEKQMFFSQKHLNLFKNANHGYFSIESLSKSIIAQENSKRSTTWDFRESRWVLSKNCLISLKTADFSHVSIECVSKGIFAWNFSKFSNFGFS